MSKKEAFLVGLRERWQVQYGSRPLMSTKENGPFSVVGIIGAVPLLLEPSFHRPPQYLTRCRREGA